MPNVDELLERIAQNGHTLWVAGPQSASAVAELEAALDVLMPPSYREFLLKYGSISIYDCIIAGIANNEPLGESVDSLYGATMDLRQAQQLPNHLLVIQSDDDAPYCFDTRQVQASGEMPVVCYELNTEYDSKIAEDFSEFFVTWFLKTWSEIESDAN